MGAECISKFNFKIARGKFGGLFLMHKRKTGTPYKIKTYMGYGFDEKQR